MSKHDKIQLSDLPPRKRRELLGLEPLPEKRHKYGVAPKEERTCDGIVFDSKKEMTRYNELKAMEASGQISRLALQPKLPLTVDGVVIGTYVGDFCYFENGVVVYEDVKGGKATKTPLYRWKKKHVLAEYGIEIRET